MLTLALEKVVVLYSFSVSQNQGVLESLRRATDFAETQSECLVRVYATHTHMHRNGAEATKSRVKTSRRMLDTRLVLQ